MFSFFRRRKEIKLVGLKAEKNEILRQIQLMNGWSIYHRYTLQRLTREIASLQEELEPMNGGFKWHTKYKSSKTD